jgi:peptidoglycan hydrolase CwlO-like protein
MNGKWRKETVLILTAILVLCGGIPSGARETLVPGDSSETTSDSVGQTIFSCQSLGDGWATFVLREGKLSTNPIITWNTKYFGDDYTPEKRCQIVSDKLTNAAVKNGGNLGNLNLRSGEIAVNNNQYMVICATAPTQPKCDLDNMLFTLKPENAKNPNLVLANMLSFTQGKASNNVVDENALPSSVALGGLVDNVFARESQKQLSAPLALPFSLIVSFVFGSVVGGLAIFLLSKKSKEPEVKRLEELVKTQEEGVKQLEGEIEIFQSKEAEATAELKRLQELVKTQENREQKAENRVKELEGKIENFQSKGAESAAELKRLEELVKTQENRVKQLEGEIENFQSKEAEATAELKRLQELVKTQKSEKQKTENRVKQLEGEIENFQSKGAESAAELKRLEELVKTQESGKQKLEKRGKELEGEIEKLKSQGADAQAEVKRLQGLVQVGEGQEQNERRRRREAEAEVE